ncbi:hypothetical protein, partial [Klebsiella pneumoniae]|uniref:hypothetical protein n=1 Tax=Klebsiella pneumoniae TaxID=573 RepID=UPI0019533B2E
MRWDDPDELFAALASSAKSRIVADVPPRLLPTLVTFRALGDPSTARVVPANVSEFANIFGLGHNFRRAPLK